MHTVDPGSPRRISFGRLALAAEEPAGVVDLVRRQPAVRVAGRDPRVVVAVLEQLVAKPVPHRGVVVLEAVRLLARELEAVRLDDARARFVGARRAQAILKDFAGYLPKFRKVMPTEYRRALADLAKAREAEGAGLRI